MRVTLMLSGMNRAAVTWAAVIAVAVAGVMVGSLNAGAADSRATAALSLDKVVTARQGTNAAVLTSPPVTTTHADELLVAFASSDGPAHRSQTMNKVTGGGLTWTLRARSNTQQGTAEVWVAAAPHIVKNLKVSATRSVRGYHGDMTVAAFTNADPSGVGALAAAHGSARAASAELTTTRPGSWVWAVGVDSSRAAARTSGPGQVVVDDFADTAAKRTFWTQRSRGPTTAPNTRVVINDSKPSTGTWNLALVEVLPRVATDSVAPKVSITSPSVGATVSGSLDITATASDNVAVTRVDYYRDQTLIGSSTTSPYKMTWNTEGPASGAYDLFAKAYDAAGNVGQSAAVRVTVTAVVPPGVDNTDFMVVAFPAHSAGVQQVMKLDSGILSAVAPSQHPFTDGSLDVSPDGSRVVFDSDRENRNPDSDGIFVADTDGSGVRPAHLPAAERPTDTGFQWTTAGSPDGRPTARRSPLSR